MPNPPHPSSTAGRRITAIALVTLTLLGVAASAASAEPDTNIQKPGHVTAQVA